ncbi:hypothetical protein ACHAWF_001976 [Thalassiosira exigua]
MRSILARLLVAALAIRSSRAFSARAGRAPSVVRGRPLPATTSGNAPVEITFPTPSEAASMGVRDWPQQFKSNDWTDAVSEGQICTRYVLEGTGRLTVDYYDDSGESQRVKERRVYPGTLVEVDGEARMYWEVDDEKEGMIVLTPGYEEGGKLLLVGGVLAAFCAGMVVASAGG